MGNRHGGEKPKEERRPKEEKKKKKKEKKYKQKGKKKGAAGSDVDVDMESSHISHADSESMVFHSAENLSPYLDASTRSEEGAACAGFQDNGHVLSSRDFHDGFSIEACLPADLAAVGRLTDVTGDASESRGTDDVTSVASGGYSTPLLSSPQVRRGIPRSPLAQRPKDSFLEPVPPIPSDFSSNTLSSAASNHEDLTSSGERSSSRASSSTIDTNAAHCIERLEELERNIERTIIEKFSDGTSPLLKRRADRESGEHSREGSVTPKRLSGGAAQGASDSPSVSRRAQEAGRPGNREGSVTPKGVVRGLPSQSLENSPVILRKPKQDSPSVARKAAPTHVSPSLPTVTLVKPESPVMRRKVYHTSPSAARRAPTGPDSPRLQHKHVGSPRTGRLRAQDSPLLRRKGVPLSDDSSSTDQEPPPSSVDCFRSRGRQPGHHDNQSSPSRSPEVRKKPGAKTPSSSPSPRSLGRKLMTTDDKKPAVGSTSPVTQIKFCELNKGTPVKHCIVSTQPSTAVVLSSLTLTQDGSDSKNGSEHTSDTHSEGTQPVLAPGASAGKSPSEKPASASQKPEGPSKKQESPSQKHESPSQKQKIPDTKKEGRAVSEEAIKESSESAVFGSVSPKLKRQKKVIGTDQSCSPKGSLERQRTESTDSCPRSPPYSPSAQRDGSSVHPQLHSPPSVVSTHSVNVIQYKKSPAPVKCISTLKYPPSPETRRSPAEIKTVSHGDGENQSSLATAAHTEPRLASPSSNQDQQITQDHTKGKGHMSPTLKQKCQGRETTSSGSAMALGEPIYSRIQKPNHSEKVEAPVITKRPVYNTTRSIDEGTTVFSTDDSDKDRGTLIRSNTVPAPAETRHLEFVGDPRGNSQQRAFWAGSTVEWNAPRGKEGTEGASRYPDVSCFDERARGASGAECGARAKLAPSSRSLSDTSGSTHTYGSSTPTSAHLGSRNLGQRIRDVIHQSSYREVFTAELSPTCLSDDPDHIPHIDDDWDAPAGGDFRKPFRGGYGGSSVDPPEDRYHSDGAYLPSSPSSRRAAARGRQSALRRTAVNRPSPDHGRDTSLSNIVVQENVSYLPESITIRRIDVDANVTLPCQQPEGQTITGPAFSSLSAYSGSPYHSASGYAPVTGFLPEMMDSSVDPDVAHTSAAYGPAEDRVQLAAADSTQQTSQHEGRERSATQTTHDTRLLATQRTHHHDTMQAETTGGSGKREETKEQTVCAADRNVTSAGKDDIQTCVLESKPGPLPHPSHPHHPAPSSVPPQQACVAATVKTEKQERKTVEQHAEFSPEAQSTVAASQNSSHCQAHAINSEASDSGVIPREPSKGVVMPPVQSAGAVISAEPCKGAPVHKGEHSADTDSRVSSPPAPRDGDVGASCAVGGIVSTANAADVSKQVTDNGTTETQDNGCPKRTGEENDEVAVSQEHVPPPSPTAMGMLLEDEEEEEEDEDIFNAHRESDISFMISKEMQQFGETVVKRLSSLLESQASESDSCLEDGGGAGLFLRDRHGASSRPPFSKEGDEDEDRSKCEETHEELDEDGVEVQSHRPGGKIPIGRPLVKRVDGVLRSSMDTSGHQDVCEQEEQQEETEDIPAVTQPTLTPSFPSAESFLTESDTTENYSETGEHETTASSQRHSTTSTATDETLTSFKTRSTTDSAEFDDAHFILPESLVFVRSVDEDDAHKVDDAVIESGNIVRRPSIPKELVKSPASSDEPPPKTRKKRRRQPASSYDNVTRGELNEPVPKRGSKQIRDVIDAYCDEESEESDLPSSSDEGCLREFVGKSDVSRLESEPALKQEEYLGQVFVRKPKPPADRSSGSSEESDPAARKRLSSSSIDSSLRIPEIEETFSELMGVKTFLEDLQDRTPTAEAVPLFVSGEDAKPKDYWSASHLRRSRTSPAKTDRTESDLDISEQRDDASTDSMYADDEDEGTEVVFQRSYSEEHGGEVLLSCTIYNSTHDNGADSDEFWADGSAAEENYRKLETAADEAGSAFQNARLQMHDIHQHLQDLRRQMELLQDDITSTSLTLTPDYSLESCEPRPVTE